MKHTALFLILTFPVLLFAQTESLFWKIEGKGFRKPSYLFGTYHLINHGFLDEDAMRVNEVMKKADRIVVESVFGDDDMATMLKYIYSDFSLQVYLGEEDFQLADSVFLYRTGDSLKFYDDMQPMFTSIIIGLAYHNQYLEDHGNYEGEPIDMFFQHYATENEIDLIGLESADESYAYLLDSTTFEEQLEVFMDIIENDHLIYDVAGDMYEYYRVNNPYKVIEAVDYYHSFVSDAGMDLITEGRNQLWMERLPQTLKKGNTFIAVGSLHLAGEKGLVNLLREAGYKVTPLPIAWERNN